MKEEKKDIKGKPSSQKGSDGRVPNAFAPIYISYSAGRSNRSGGMKIDPKSGMTQEELAFEKVKKYLLSQYENVTFAELEGGERIKDFEDKYEKSKIVVVILSNEYLYSEHCMYEWTQMQKSHKTIIYVKTSSFSPNKENLTEFWVKFLRDNIEKKEELLSLITIEALKNNCYLGVLGKFWGTLKDRIRNQVAKDEAFKLSDNDKTRIDKAIDKAKKRYTEIIDHITNYRTILMIGDFILSDERKESCRIEEERDLEVAIQEHKNLSTDSRIDIRQYNRYEYKRDAKFEREAFARMDKYYSTEYFENLLETDMFDTIISFAFSKQIDKVINEYVKSKKYKIEWFALQDSKFAQKNLLTSSKTDEKSTDKKVIHFYDAVYEEKHYGKSGSEGRIIFAEKDIVDFTVRLINAMSANDLKKVFFKKNVLALGTNFPGWSLRFIFSSLYINDTTASFLSNRPVDGKTENFLRENNGNFENIYIINEDFMPEFIKELRRITREKVEGKKLLPAIPRKKCYLFYFQSEIKDYMESKPKFQFLWDNYDVTERTDIEEKVDIQDKVLESDFVVLYNSRVIGKDSLNYAEQGRLKYLRRAVENYKKMVVILHKDFYVDNKLTSFIKEKYRKCIFDEDLQFEIDQLLNDYSTTKTA